MATFRYRPIDIISLSALDLQQEAAEAHRKGEEVNAYAIAITNGVKRAEALYLPRIHRLGIAVGATVTWATVADVASGIDMWLNHAEQWKARN